MPRPEWLKYVDQREIVVFRHEFEVLERYASEVITSPEIPFKKTSLGHELLCRGRESHVGLVRGLLAAIQACRRARDEQTCNSFLGALAVLLRRNVALTQDDVTTLLLVVTTLSSIVGHMRLLGVALDTIQRVMGSRDLPAEQHELLVGLRDQLLQFGEDKQPAKLLNQIDRLCDQWIVTRLHPDDGWADDLKCWLADQTPAVRGRWDGLLRDAANVRLALPVEELKTSAEEPSTDITVEDGDITEEGAPGSEALLEAHHRLRLGRLPTPEWKQRMAGRVCILGHEYVAERLCHWLGTVPDSRPGMLARESLNRELLRGLLYLCCDLAGPQIVDGLTGATKFFFQNNSPLAETGVIVLYHIGNRASLAGLAVVAQSATGSIQLHFIRFARATLAEPLGLDPDDLSGEEFPSFGFTGLGELLMEFGSIQAKIAITGARTPQIIWSRQKGKVLRTIPAAVKREHQAEINALKVRAKDVREFLTGLARRMESTWLGQTRISLEGWRRQLIDHPVAGVIGRRLIWKFVAGAAQTIAFWHDAGLVDSTGASVLVPAAGSVQLWHPLDATTEVVLVWRDLLEKHAITQPFKQAHREIYLLTDAERQTRTYSNRFAGHVVRQAQFRRLAKIRGWQVPLVGNWDGGDRQAAERKLPRWHLRAEYWVGGAGAEDLHYHGCTYLATDQVRFYAYQPGLRTSDVPLALDTVPPLAFSEVMRDVDLFVGVSSVGNDPNWCDGGPDNRYRDYWRDYAFGDLSATAQTRKAVLEHLIPRLTIADRCSFSERFLLVRGELRSYKVHLGSGNILMAPNDQYLCIVAKPSAGSEDGKLFLPFEGDAVLSQIVSKALLLAEDTKITDPTILSDRSASENT
jgi:hypothetical protein